MKDKFRYEHYLILLSVLSLVIFTLLHTIGPYQDFGLWTYEGFSISEAIQGQPLEGYSISTVPKANVLAVLVLTVLHLIASPMLASKMFIILYAIVFSAGATYLLTSLTPPKKAHLLLPLAGLFTANYFLYHGNMNYVLGLGVLFFGWGYLLRTLAQNKNISLVTLIVLTLLSYFSHPIIFVLHCMLAFFLALTVKKHQWKKLLIGVLPSIVLLTIYAIDSFVVKKSIYTVTQTHMTFIASLIAKFMKLSAYSIVHGFHTLPKSTGLAQEALFFLNIAFLAFIGALLLFTIILVLRNKKIRMTTGALITVAVSFLLAFILPDDLAALINPGERFLIPALFLSLTLLQPHLNFKKNSTLAMRGIMTVFVLAQILFLFTAAAEASQHLEKIYTQQQSILPDDDSWMIVNQGQFRFIDTVSARIEETKPHMLPMHAPVNSLEYYHRMKRRERTMISETSMLSDNHAEIWPRFTPNEGSEVEYPAVLIVVAERDNQQDIEHYLSGYKLVATSDSQALYRLRDS